MTKDDLLLKLETLTSKKIDLNLKEYKSTFLSVVKHNKSRIKLSLHKLFLEADDYVIDSIVRYILKHDKQALKIIKIFAGRYFSKVDYSHLLDKKKLKRQGKYYDLQNVYDLVNHQYFDGKLDLNITWFKKPHYRRCSHFTFGSYDKVLKLIRINSLMDSIKFPFYFIYFVVYHEMLHHIFTEIIDENGRRKVHTKEFKQKEKQFAYYKEAIAFEKNFLKKG